MHRVFICLALTFFAVTVCAADDKLPSYYLVPDDTLSPDKSLGVTVPKIDDPTTPQDAKNEIVEVKTGRVLGAINVGSDFVAADHTSNSTIEPTTWSADNSMLLWQVDGKWGFNTEMLVKLENGKIKSQLDVLKLLEQEILKRTLKAVPDKYAAVKATSSEYGSWYQDGFAIDCVEDSTDTAPLKFPLHYQVYLTSNTKGLPDMVNVDSRMTAEVNADGTVKVDDFHMGTDPPARNW